MKNWKRIAALAMSAVMVGGMLTGCGGGGGSTEAAKDNAPKAEAGAEAGKDEGGASADSGEKKQVYVFIRDRGDLSYWATRASEASSACVISSGLKATGRSKMSALRALPSM